MNRRGISFHEIEITRFNEALVQVRVELPSMTESLTSAIIIDEDDLFVMAKIKPPEELQLLEGMAYHAALIMWEQDAIQARKAIDIVANKVALHLAHTLKQPQR